MKKTEKANINKIKCPVCNLEMNAKSLPSHSEIHPTLILDWLYIGSYYNATNKTELKNLNIKYVLNCANECKNLFSDNFTYLKLPLKDTLDFPIENYFDVGINFLKECLNKNNLYPNEKGNVLVHCQLGKSRSASIVLAYLVKENKMSVNEAFTFVKKKRKNILPNMAFMLKLRDLEKNILLEK